MKVIVGSAGIRQEGFVSTDKDTLNLLDRESFIRFGGPIHVLFSEHVWEHITAEQGFIAAVNCYACLVPGGILRIAVPDSLHPDPAYREWVRPGGVGAGAGDHKVEYNYITLTTTLLRAGFSTIKILEWWDGEGRFHRNEWDVSFGYVYRSSIHDYRNKVKPLSYTSLIIDAIKGE